MQDTTPNLAHMDPWLLVTDNDEPFLFGFVLAHPELGGLSWSRSSAVIDLDVATGCAHTASGRHYRLGHRLTDSGALPTEEARVAWNILVLEAVFGIPAQGLPSDPGWVAACKMARWVTADPPPRENAAAIEAFLASYAERYLALRRAGAPAGRA